MGNNQSIYIKDEFLDNFENEGNKSALINHLLELHYSNDLDFLRIKHEFYKSECKLLEIKINKQAERARELEKKELEIKTIKKKETERAELIEAWQFAFNSGQITDKDYWDAYDAKEKTFDLDILKVKLKGVNHEI